MYTVYMHICPNGKKYIGVTSKEPKQRWKHNGIGYKQNKHFYNAIELYGWDNIEHNIVASNLTREEAYQMEIDLIAKYKSNNKKFGYNNSLGGEYSLNGYRHTEETKQLFSKQRKGMKFSEEHKNNIRKALIGIKRSDETKQKLREIRLGTHASEELKKHFSETRKGKLNPRYGVHLSKETKEKISAAKKGYKLSQEQKALISEQFCKPVICIETGKKYYSIKEAAKDIGVDSSCISAMLHGDQKTVKKMHFAYLEK